MFTLSALFATSHSAKRLHSALCLLLFSSGLSLAIYAPITAAFDSESAGNITFLLSAKTGVYQRISDITQKRIEERCKSESFGCGNLNFDKFSIDDSLRDKKIDSGLKIMLGTKAAALGNELFSNAILLNAMIPFSYDTMQKAVSNQHVFNVYIDQPYTRYFDLIKLTIPRAGRIGVLIHESNLNEANELEKIASANNIALKTAIVGRERNVGEALSLLLDNIDVLLALPDARIHNSKTISHILTTAYRNNIPVIGFSSAYVKAGATAAVYTSPENIAHQLSDLVAEYFKHQSITNTNQRATYYSIAFNYEVTRSLGLPTFSTREIKSKISKGQKQ